MFNLDKIRSGESYDRLVSIFGGHEGLLPLLKTDFDSGIEEKTVKSRENFFGSNILLPKELITFSQHLQLTFDNIPICILLVVTIGYLVLGIMNKTKNEQLEAEAILVFVAIFMTIASIINFSKELEKQLKEIANNSGIFAIRDGRNKVIFAFDLVVGDIATVKVGDAIPADALILFSSNLTVDESSITGGVCNVKKAVEQNDTESPFLLANSIVLDGEAKILILAVESKRFYRNNTNPPQDRSVLQKSVNNFADSFGKKSQAASMLIFCVLIIKGIEVFDSDSILTSISPFGADLILSLSIVVGSISVLYLGLSLILIVAAKQMKEKKNFVRNLHEIETMGQITCICTDKTGILTYDNPRVISMSFGREIIENTSKNSLDQEVIDIIIKNICHNSTAAVDFDNKPMTVNGNGIDIAIIKLGKKWGYDYNKIRNEASNHWQIPTFDSNKKTMTSVVTINDKAYVFLKGSTERVLNLCTKFATRQGNLYHLNEGERKYIYDNVISNYGNRSYRSIALGYKILDNPNEIFNNRPNHKDELESDFILTGIFGIQDPVKPDISNTIELCKNAGITVRMVTGDNRETAIAVAKKCGILPKNYKFIEGNYVVMNGSEFNKAVDIVEINEGGGKRRQAKDTITLKKILPQLRVLAMCSSEDKKNLTTVLREYNELLALIGDSASHAGALKKSNVGISINSAAHAAKNASEIILLDNNFSSVMTSILWGRQIYNCIRKFIQFQLTMNFVGISMILIGAINTSTSYKSNLLPITAAQLLWVTLIISIFAAFAFVIEPLDKLSLLKNGPITDADSLLTLVMVKKIVGQCAYQLFWLIPIYILNDNFLNFFSENDDHPYPYSFLFQVFVMFQIFNEINCRNPNSNELNMFKGFFKNLNFLIIIILTIIAQILFVTFGGSFLSVESLSVEMHGFSLIVGAGCFIFEFIFRLLPTNLFRFFHEEKYATVNALMN